MSESRQKLLVRRFYDELWNHVDRSGIEEILAAGFRFRGSLGPEYEGRDGFWSYVEGVHAALADYRCDILDLVEEGDRVVARMRFHGIHRGPLMGRAPTGRRVEWAGSAHFRFADDGIAALWVLGDLHALEAQLAGGTADAGR